MHVDLHPSLQSDPAAQRAAELTKACVHCGFCLESCPTYRDLRDERDSPRGRIYLIKHLLESGSASAHTRQHLDRCLTCRGCETSCPSGMQYGELLDIGRDLVEDTAPRSLPVRLWRGLLRNFLKRPTLLAPALRIAQSLATVLPRTLRQRVPARQRAGSRPVRPHHRKVLLLEGCVQQVATPATNGATRRVLDRLGIEVISAAGSGCCGALSFHLAAQEEGLADMRRNIDAWWPAIDQGVEAIVSTASGCGVMLSDYGRCLAHDPDYAEKAARVASLSRDLSQLLVQEDLSVLMHREDVGPIALHAPCTLQHGQRLANLPGEILHRMGFDLAQTRDGQLCCGSAGTYSLLQPAISSRLRERKLAALTCDNPQIIATANVGCQLHLAGAADIPVVHWVELLDRE